MIERNEVAAIVKEILVEVLAVEPDEITPDVRFFADLDGESIDLLDTQFHLDKKLKISINFQKMLGGESLTTDSAGQLTADAIEKVRAALPFLDFERLPPQATLDALIRELLTVDAITEITWLALHGQTSVAAATA